MGLMKERATGRDFVLDVENIVGRSPRCVMRVDGSLVSSVHASLRWTPCGWELRDLGSTNGTFVNGTRLGPGKLRLLSRGDAVAFGAETNVWELVEESPPGAMVMAEGEAATAPLTGQIIGIPSADGPRVVIYRNGRDGWCLEIEGEGERPLEDGERFRVGDVWWRFSCPGVALHTSRPLVGDVRRARLAFVVSRDEEHVELVAHVGSHEIDFGSRAHHYVLLTLARQRLFDTEQSIPESSCGWMYANDLARAIAEETEHVNVAVFRIRRQFAQHFDNAAEIIERRHRSGQLRIAVGDLEIATI
jgi:pSer/pThr/pTyr-binding forkhead associated (FHA) protein